MLRTLLVLPLLLAVFVLIPSSAGAQDDGREFCTSGPFSASSHERCRIWPVQTIDDAYRYGQAIYIECGTYADRKPFACPRKKDVDLKVTVIKSVKKALGLSSTTISAREAIGPLTVKLEEDEEKQTYYFMPLRASVERKMKAKKARNLTVTVSGTATGRDGKVKRFPRTRSEWSFNGNCQGMGLKIQRHVTYGGSCYRH